MSARQEKERRKNEKITRGEQRPTHPRGGDAAAALRAGGAAALSGDAGVSGKEMETKMYAYVWHHRCRLGLDTSQKHSRENKTAERGDVSPDVSCQLRLSPYAPPQVLTG